VRLYKILPRLYIGGQFDKRPGKLDELREYGVNVVVSMLRKTDPDMAGLDDIEYYKFPLSDASFVDERVLSAAVYLTRGALSNWRTVLVHCISAYDRSPLVAATVVALEGHLTGAEAINWVRARRGPVALRNVAFQDWLRRMFP